MDEDDSISPPEDSRVATRASEQPEIPDLNFKEDSALALLQRPDLPAETIELISKSGSVMNSRKVKVAVASHPRTPRHVSVPLIRQLFTFDLMKLSLMPAVAADLKKVSEDALINRLEAITLGEKISLARRASGRVAGALLRDRDRRVAATALENDRLTESLVIQAISKAGTSFQTVALVCGHERWSYRKEVRGALLRSEHTPHGLAIEFARSFTVEELRELLAGSRMTEDLKNILLEGHEQGSKSPPGTPEF